MNATSPQARAGFTKRELDKLRKERWVDARASILPKLAKELADSCPSTWVPSDTLFNVATLQGMVPLGTFSFGMWRGVPCYESGGTHAYEVEGNTSRQRYALLRHLFGPRWHFCASLMGRRHDVDHYIQIAMVHSNLPRGSNAGSSLALDEVVDRLSRILKTSLIPIKDLGKLVLRRAEPLLVTPDVSARSTSARLVAQLQGETKNPRDSFQDLSDRDQERVLTKLLATTAERDSLKLKVTHLLKEAGHGTSALTLLRMFQTDFSRQSFVNRLLNSSGVGSSNGLFPRTSNFNQLSDKNKDNLVSVMTSLAITIAKTLLPRDVDEGATALLQRMTDNSSFLKFALPNSNDDKDSYTQWTLSPVVTAIKVAIDKLGMKDQELQRQLLSLLSSYPKAWIMDFFDVGRALATKARDHSAAFGPGQRPLTSSKIKRERRVGPIEDFFQEWIRRPENTEASPEIKRSGSGNLMTGQICYRILCRNKGYEKYCIDAKKEGCPSYGKTHFYLRNDEMGLVDTKSEGGLCPNCTKYGKETWDWLLRCTEFVYSQTDTRRRSAREAVAKYSNYFVRGGHVLPLA